VIYLGSSRFSWLEALEGWKEFCSQNLDHYEFSAKFLGAPFALYVLMAFFLSGMDWSLFYLLRTLRNTYITIKSVGLLCTKRRRFLYRNIFAVVT